MIFKKFILKEVIIWLFFIFVGLVSVFFIPPFQKPDEGDHYLNVLTLVGTIRPLEKSNNCLYLSEEKMNLATIFRSGEVMHNYSSKFPISLYRQNLFLKDSVASNTCLPKINNNLLVGYIPSIVGVLFAYDFPVIGFYLARLFPFLLFSFCIYVAYKIINKKYRNIILIYCCIPMVWQQVTAISYDALVLSLVPLLLVLFMKFWINKRLHIWDLIKAILLLVIISLAKPGNEIYLFLILLFPFEKIFTKLLVVRFMLLRFLLFIVLTSYFLLRTFSTGLVSASININQSIQKEILFSDPIYVFNVGINSLKVNSSFYLGGFLGNFGWLDYHLDDWTYYLIVISLVSVYVLMVNKIEKSVLSYGQILSLFLFIFINIGLSFAVMYIAWTPVASRVIEGVQGRYFLPIFPFLLFTTSELISKIGKNKSKNIFLSFSVFIIFISVVTATYKRYYDYSRLYQNETELIENYSAINKISNRIDTVLLNKEVEVNITLEDKKFSALQLIIKLPEEKISIPYRYLIADENGKIVQKGYLVPSKMVDSGIYQEEFKIKEVNTKSVTIKIWPMIISDKENYISLLRDVTTNSFLVNLLYIRK